MTEAEELELLELEEEEARAVKAAGGSTPRHDPTTGEAIGRGAVQGATMGFGDEANAAIQALTPEYSPADNPAKMLLSPMLALRALAAQSSGVPLEQLAAGTDNQPATLGDVLRRKVQEYQLNRDADRAANKAAKDAHPWAYGTADVVAGLPAAIAMPGGQGRTVGSLAKAGGISGALAGAGGSEADLTQGDVGGFLKDTAAGGALGAGLGAGAGLLGKLVGRAGEGIRNAEADNALNVWGKLSKAERVARSSLGGEVAAILNEGRRAEEALASTIASPEVKAKAAALLADPAFIQRFNSAMAATVETGASRLPGSVQTAQNVLESARAAKAPAAFEQAAEEAISNPIKTQIAPRLRTIATRMIPTGVGAALGGPAGAAVGGVVGAVQGAPGTTVRNMLVSPSVRKLGWELLQKLGLAGSSPLTTAAARDAVQTLENQP